jgi:hypothetical protein
MNGQAFGALPTAVRPPMGTATALAPIYHRAATIVQTLAEAERRLNNGFALVQQAQLRNPHAHIQPAHLMRYNAAVEVFTGAASSWARAHANTPADKLSDAGAAPRYPLPFRVVGGGLGAAALVTNPNFTVPLSQVATVLTVDGKPQIVQLGSIDLNALTAGEKQNQNGLGFVWVLVVFFIGLYIVADVIKTWRETGASEEASEAAAKIALAQAQQAEAVLASYNQTLTACKGDPNCVAQVATTLPTIAKQIRPSDPMGKSKSFGPLEVVGVLAIVAAVGAGGFALWRWRKRRQENVVEVIPTARVQRQGSRSNSSAEAFSGRHTKKLKARY